MGTDCCRILKILGLCLTLIMLGGVIFFGLCGCRKGKGIKGKASRVFNDMGELIGEFSFKK